MLSQVLALIEKLPESETNKIGSTPPVIAERKSIDNAPKDTSANNSRDILCSASRFMKSVHLISFRSLRHVWRDPRWVCLGGMKQLPEGPVIDEQTK